MLGRGAEVLEKGLSVRVGVANRLPDSSWLIGLHTGTANRRVNETARRERLVADHFCIETETRAACEEAILGVEFDQFLFNRRLLSVGL